MNNPGTSKNGACKIKSVISSVFSSAKTYSFIIPTLIIEVLMLISMCASIQAADGVFMTVAHIGSFISLLLFICRPASHLIIKWLLVAIAQGAVLLDVFVLSGSERTRTFFDTTSVLAGCVIFVLILVASFSKSRMKSILGHCGGICISSVVCAEVFAIYASVGTHFMNEDPIFVILGHAVAALAMLVCYYKPKLHILMRLAYVVSTPFIAFFLLEFLTHNPLYDTSFSIILLNIAFFAALLAALAFITGHTAPAVTVAVILPLIMGLVSYFTMKFRGTPLFPWDLASYGIAATVLGGYDLTIPPKIALIISTAVLTCITSFIWNVRIKFAFSKIVRPIVALCVCVLIAFGGVYIQTDKAISDFDLFPYLFTPDHLYKKNGFAVSFLMNLRYTTVEKPDGYNVDLVSSIANDYESDNVTAAGVKPNVIVIMNESFADMKALCDFETNTPYLPFIYSLEDNAVKGNLHVSVVGGNTPNSEFEFLTGMSMGYLPAGSIPYQQFLKSERPSFASQLNDLGYHTVAMHPYWAEGWKRETVYPYLGFEEMHFLNYDTYGSFNDYHRIRDYISDKGVYDKIRLTYEENGDGEPLFIFAVTMQNHSGYTQIYDNLALEVKVEGLENNIPLSTYMSLVRESDSAFKGLIEYFEKADEPTVILMFGDHQPNDSIAEPLMKQAGMVYNDSDIESSEMRFTVPYVMWSNFGMDVDAPEDVSINYLSTLLMDAAGLPKTGAQKYASTLINEFPVITGRCIIDKNGKISPVSDYSLYEGLNNYAYLEYCYLFDKDKMPDGFWSLK